MVGRSLGSGVAMQVAVRRAVERLVLITPFDSLVATGADLFPLAAGTPPAPRPVGLRGGRPPAWPPGCSWSGPGVTMWSGPPAPTASSRSCPSDTAVLDLPDAAHGTLHEDPAYWPAIEDFLT